ncbi:hypothetical protein D3C87_2125140 [compost metagenome]
MKPFGQSRQHRAGSIDRHHALRQALKDRLAELGFGLDDLLADGTDRHAEFVRRRLQ